jgi:glyoxylase I family protein
MAITGVSHVGLTVSDLAASKQWYADVLGWQALADGASEGTTFVYGQLPGGTALVLRQHDAAIDGAFDERRPGLDHLSLSCSALEDLSELTDRLAARHATFSPIQTTDYASVLSFRDPDNIALELTGPLP